MPARAARTGMTAAFIVGRFRRRWSNGSGVERPKEHSADGFSQPFMDPTLLEYGAGVRAGRPFPGGLLYRQGTPPGFPNSDATGTSKLHDLILVLGVQRRLSQSPCMNASEMASFLSVSHMEPGAHLTILVNPCRGPQPPYFCCRFSRSCGAARKAPGEWITRAA